MKEDKLKEESHNFMMSKGVLSNKDKLLVPDVKNWLVEFARNIQSKPDVAVPVQSEIKEGDKVKCLYRDSGHKFWKDQFDKGLTVDKVFLKDNVPNELRFKEIPNQLFYSNDFVAVPVEKDINIKVLFSVFKNEDRKQFEFTPKVNGYTSYTVSFKECDNEEDAYKAVYKSITAEARRGAEKILADVAVPIQKDFCFNCYEDVPIKLIENSKVCTICDHLINPMQSKPIVEEQGKEIMCNGVPLKEPIKSPEEILGDIFGCGKDLSELQLYITLNPSLDRIKWAMEKYKSQSKAIEEEKKDEDAE